MSRRRARGLRPEERRLWEDYAKGMRPTLPDRADVGEQPTPSAPAAARKPPKDPIPAFRIGEAAHDRGSTALTPAPGPWDGPRRMDAKTFGKLRKGQVRPEGRIDLHGMTVDEAHTALIAFVLSRQARGNRLVLVITGKGKGEGPAPVERGVLRRQVPHWLSLPPLAGAVMDVTPAHRRHGGEGAFYVYLRRLR